MMVSIISFLTTLAMFAFPFYMFISHSKKTQMGAMSLPCFTSITTMIYFYFMPAITSIDENANYLGIYLSGTHWMEFAVTLYFIGASAAFIMWKKNLSVNIYNANNIEKKFNMVNYFAIILIIVSGIFYLIISNKLNLFGSAQFELNRSEMNDFAFVNVVFNMSITLAVVTLIKRNFDLFSILIIIILVWILVQAGFRYRILILGSSAVTAFFIIKGIKLRVGYAILGVALGIFIVNLLGLIRRYGEGVDFSRLEGEKLSDLFTKFSGEAGVTFVTDYIASHPLPPPVYFEPWVVAITRLVPSFIWSNKPSPTYLTNILAGATTRNSEFAGAAAPQHVEILFQFGWIGLPVMGFIYFSIAILLLGRINKLGREARIAGFALVPAFFGYYMQTRGYFSQIFSDGLFFFVPLFMLHWGDKAVKMKSTVRTLAAFPNRQIPDRP